MADGAGLASPVARSAPGTVGASPATSPPIEPRGVKTSPSIRGLRARLSSRESMEHVAQILLVTRHHLRLYPADTLRLVWPGDPFLPHIVLASLSPCMSRVH
jgi:hypothetical protein